MMNEELHNCQECQENYNNRCEAFGGMYIEVPEQYCICEKFKGVFNNADYPNYSKSYR